ncbi:MAG: hypothetical protein JSU86_20610 [Phycisphaerales bacterium]|nr:MAG: hypothetical protein JSU86_20610 [Phycisphaerales bacterium]
MWPSAFRTSVLTLAIGVFVQTNGRSAQAQCEVAKLTAPGVCVDDDGSGGGMDEELCTELGGTFTGGADCGSVTEFCPSCVIKGDGNCQVSDFAGLFQMHLSDMTVPPFGVTSADDFIPAGDTIGSICVWGTYMDSSAPSPLGSPYEEYSCVGHVKDNFRIRIYQDVGGFPGSQVGGDRWVSGEDVYRAEIPADNYFTSVYSISVLSQMLTLDPPIVLPEANVTYWLEVVNKTDTLAGETEPTENTCYWHWAQVYREYGIGNDYSVMGTDDRPDDQGGGSGYIPWAASARSTDLAFCLGAPDGALAFITPETPLGSCCMCDQTCQADQTLEDCDDQLTGTWLPQDGCPTNLCEPQAGRTCAGSRAGLWIPPEGGLFGFDTSCAPTDGPAETIGLPREYTFVHDLWMAYVTNCTGRLVVSMCATGNSNGAYDSVLALYSDHSGTCRCPLSSESQQGTAKDENCNGIPDSGAGIYTSDIVYPGECWLIRAGGLDFVRGNEAGAGLIDVRCVPAICTPSHPPEPDVLPLAGEPVNQKVRYLSFQVGEVDAGREQAIRVTFVDLPAGYESWNGTKMFVGPPEMYCENAGKKRPPCPPGQPMTEFKAATLQCNAEVREWSAEGVVHVFHEGIIPGGVYHVQAVDKTCELDLDSSYSDPLIVQMSPWGDLVTDCTTCPCGPPDGVVGIPTDVTAVLDKFRNLAPPSVPCPAVSKVRADLDWATPNQRVDISDVTFCLDAFRGFEYPFGVADPCP